MQNSCSSSLNSVDTAYQFVNALETVAESQQGACMRRAACVLQEALVVTVRDAWGQPVPAGAVTLQVSPRDAAQQQPTSHKLQHGAATGEFLYDVAASKLKPGSYL